MYIGKLAKLSGATPKAIRLYESMGLIPTPVRRGKYRIYSTEDVVLVHMIRRGQAVGFSLEQMRQLLELRIQTGQFPLNLVCELILQKRQMLKEDMAKLAALDQQLVDLQDEINRTFV